MFDVFCEGERVAIITGINLRDACEKWCDMVHGTEVHSSEGLVFNDYRVWLIKEGV